MLVGQQVGPFVIDKELGSGAMGTVYRGRYTKTGQVVAIKVMAPGLGAARSNAVDRFEREAEILKQMNHPNIVRLFGVGKHQGVRYFAMEYIQGESLDKVMARRGRMSWEEVVELGRQLCLALQHAHEKGIIHRDLKPSNLMVLTDGTLKLTDFGIAKDTDVTQLTSANCTVGTAAYMSPEQCKGDRDLSHKSDLYSLGVLLYELITGRKPFNAENAMEMFLQHVQGTFPRPAKLVLELPVWLDNLICQLLEKKPENRPLDAAMVYNVLGSIKEKVEAQQSAGVDAARRRMIDRTAGTPRLDEEDKEAARFLLRGKVRPRRKPGKPFYERAWFQAAGLLTILAGVGTILWIVFRPPSADRLYAAAERLMKSGSEEKQDEARDGPMREYLTRYGPKLRDDPRTQQVRQWADDIDTRRCENKLQRYLKMKDRKLPYHPDGATEEVAFKAADNEADGKLEEAAKRWQQLTEDPMRGWQLTARRHLQQLGEAEAREKDLLRRLKGIHASAKESKPDDEAERQAFLALRYEQFGDLERADKGYKALKEQSREAADRRVWFLLAARKLKDMKPTATDRRKLVKDQLTKAQELKAMKEWQGAQSICLDIIALYGDDKEEPEIKELVPQARELLKVIAASGFKTTG